MEELLRELLAEVRALRREAANAMGRRSCFDAQEDKAGVEMVGEQGPEVRAFGSEGGGQEAKEGDFDYGGDFFWMSNAENSREQEDLLGRFLVVAQNIKCCSTGCAFHKMRFGCALKGVYLAHGKCSQFLPREEWLKINEKMGVR
jgi:hypothetical protein